MCPIVPLWFNLEPEIWNLKLNLLPAVAVGMPDPFIG